MSHTHEEAAKALNKPSSQNEDEEMLLDPDEAAEEIPEEEDARMDSDDDEMVLQNDSVAHFDHHNGNSIFCIAQHPTHATIIATGGGEDDESKDAGFGFIFDVATAPGHTEGMERQGLQPLQKLQVHTDSISALTFTLPDGSFVATAGLDGRLVAYQHLPSASPPYKHIDTAQEVDAIEFLLPCPHPEHPHTLALGANDGSVWVYTIDPAQTPSLSIVQTYYIHTSACTAGAWTSDGKFLATVSEDGSFYVWDVWGEAGSGQQVVGLTSADERFKVDGGLYSVAVSPNGTLAAVGGAEGQIRVVGLPRVGVVAQETSKKGKQTDKAGAGQAGAILASLTVGTDSVETIDFAPAPLTLLAAGTVDGSVSVFDTSKNFLLRRRVQVQAAELEDDGGHAIVKVEFVNGRGGDASWLLTSAGLDGVLRRYDLRSSGVGQGLLGEWKGHRGRGGGGGDGIMGFVQGLEGGKMVVTAGDDGVALVFDMSKAP